MLSLTSLRARLLIGIFVLLSCVYMLTYSSFIKSSDTWFLFNGVGSLVHFGDWGQDLTADEKFPTPTSVFASRPYPIRILEDDPLSVILATPLYWLADKLPGVGLVHTVWLFNVFITAAAGCVMFLYALTLGYDERVGVVAALALGLSTIVWAYSKTFFQENLTLLITLSLALALERWRTSRYRSWRALIFVVALAICLPYSKWSSVIAIVGLLMVAMPTLIKHDSRLGRLMPRVELALFAAMLVVLLLLAYTGLGRVLPVDWWNTRIYIITLEPRFLQPAVQSYLFSIGASVWATSPVVILALAGFVMLYRQRKTRYIWIALLILVAYVLGYALLRSIHWFGGLSWPPRFLVPTIPFLMICALPVLQKMFASTPKVSVILARTVFSILFLYGIWIQFSAVSVRWTIYPTLLPPDTGVAWGGGINTVPYLRWVVLPRIWGQIPFDFAWVRMDAPLWAVMFAVLGVVSAAWLFWNLTAKAQRTQREEQKEQKERSKKESYLSKAGYIALPLALVICTYLGLRMIYRDPEFFTYNTPLFDMLPIMETETQQGDVVLITSRDQRQFLLNYGKSERWRGIAVSYLPGERYVPSVEPLVAATNLVNPLAEELTPLLPINTPWLIGELAAHHERLWLLAEFGGDMAWTVRPVERYLTRQYYPVSATQTAPSVRLLQYDTTAAPIEPEATTDFVYGEAIALAGYALPQGTTYSAGDNLPLSLFWQAQTAVEQDYTVALFLANDGGVVAQGMDSAPDGGFSRTSLWTQGIEVQDNRALRLPADLAAGQYQVWVLMYPTGSDGSQRLAVTGADVREETIAVLPVTISVLP